MKTFYKNEKGFTLIEVLVVIGILAVIATLGLFVSMDFFRSRSSHSEQETIVSLLQNARSQSMNNINQARHGVHFDVTASPLEYTLFECGSGCSAYAGGTSYLNIKASYGVKITTPASSFDIIFNQLRGDTSAQATTINDGVRDYTVSVNSEGRIDWN